MDRVYLYLLLVFSFCLPYAIASSYTSSLTYSFMHPELEGLYNNNFSSVLDFIYSLPEYKLENPPLIYSYIPEPTASFFEDNSVSNYKTGIEPTSHLAHSSYSSSNYQQGAHLPQNYHTTSSFSSHSQPNLYSSNKGQVYFDDDNEYSRPSLYPMNAKEAVAKVATPSPIDLNLIQEVLSYVLNNLDVIQKSAVTIKSINMSAISNLVNSDHKMYQQSINSAKYHQSVGAAVNKPHQPSYKSSSLPIQSHGRMFHQARSHVAYAKSYNSAGPMLGQANHYQSAKPHQTMGGGHIKQYQTVKPMNKVYTPAVSTSPHTPLSFMPFPKGLKQQFPVTAHTQYIPGVGRVAIPLPPNVIRLKLPRGQQLY